MGEYFTRIYTYTYLYIGTTTILSIPALGGGFKHVFCSFSFWEMIELDDHILFKWVEIQPPPSTTIQVCIFLQSSGVKIPELLWC